MKKYLIALDQGTTSSRCLIINKQGQIICMAQKEIKQYFPQIGWVEHDPMEIWSTQLSVLSEAMAKGSISYKEIAAIGITNQRETTILWDKHTGKPVYNAIVWQCRRTSSYCDTLKAQGYEQMIQEKTGLPIDAYFSATKIRWILENVPDARKKAENGDLLFGTVDSWLIWQLTGGKTHITDYTNAARTMMFNIHTLQWDTDILNALDIPAALLPEVRSCSEVYATVSSDYLSGNIPIAGVAGDQQAALFGQCCFETGSTKNTYGTGCFILMNTGEKAVQSKNGLLTTIAWGINGQIEYALEGSVFIAGAAIQWLRDGLELINHSAECEWYATQVEDTGGVYFVPAFTGLGAPYWNQDARGTLVGITRGTKKAHFIRATLESLAYQSYDVIKAMQIDAQQPITSLHVDGGASANNFLMQFQSNLLNANVIRPKVIESTALGAAYLAGLAVGYYKDKQDIIHNIDVDKTFTPCILEKKRNLLIDGWKQAIVSTIAYADK